MLPEDKKKLKEKIKKDSLNKKIIAKEKSTRAKAAKKMPQMVNLPELTGDAERDSIADLDAVKAGFRERAKTENNRFELTTDSEYWVAVCFQTREQKEFLLKAMELFEHGDKYIDGNVLAERLGISLPPGNVPYKPDGKVVKTWLEFVK
ncbi:TPA: hypothetical protein N2G45_002876 [Salmonella enterica]|nr:hypothetical protein [Salmonella enterica]